MDNLMGEAKKKRSLELTYYNQLAAAVCKMDEAANAASQAATN